MASYVMVQSTDHIVFLCSRLDLPGGTERAVVNTASLLCSHGHNVTILILDETDASFYPIHPQVHVAQAGLHFGLTEQGNMLTRKLAFIKHILRLGKQLRAINAPIIISTDYVFTIAAWLAVRKKNFKIYAWEHHTFNRLQKSLFWNVLYTRIYPALKGIICLNRDEAAAFKRMGCEPVVIPNFIEPTPEAALLSQNTILTIGRLEYGKGVDLVPEIAEAVLQAFPDWRWKIIGTGAEHGVLKKLLVEKGQHTHVQIVEPVTSDMGDEYRAASLYVMLSQYECFPMVLLEAMASGVPCLSFNCPTGPAHIIQNSIDGILVEPGNTSAMINAISELIKNAEKRKRMGAAAYENVRRFAPEKIYELWRLLFTAGS